MFESPSVDGRSDNDPIGDLRGLTARFLMATARQVGDRAVVPDALARAAAEVVGVDGAGLSTMVSVLRQPLATTSNDSRQAEELQTSLGEGPCLFAVDEQVILVADLDELQARWLLYAQDLVNKTAFRGVASLPLRVPGGQVFAALDLYSTNPRISEQLEQRVLRELGEILGALLMTCMAQIPDVGSPEDGPDWYQQASGRRQDVWVAIGMVMGRRAARTRDALSVLRARAYSDNRSLDDIAEDLVRGRMPLTDLAD